MRAGYIQPLIEKYITSTWIEISTPSLKERITSLKVLLERLGCTFIRSGNQLEIPG